MLWISICLLMSLFIYVFYRTERTLINEIIIRTISFKKYAEVKAWMAAALPLHVTIVYSLPEGLWVFCITLTSKPFYIQVNQRKIYGFYIPILFCIGLEIFQLLHITNGQFDPEDIGISLIFWLAGILSFNESPARQNILAPFNREKLICISSYCIVYLSHVFS